MLIDLYGLGTNTGIKRLSLGELGEKYQDLLYVRRKFIHKSQLRNAIAEIINATFAAKLPHIWGEGTTTCASDSKKFGGASILLASRAVRSTSVVRSMRTAVAKGNVESTYVDC